MCHGQLKRELVKTQIDDVVITDVLADVCERCGEQYFDTKTATFIQKVTKYIGEQKRACMMEELQQASSVRA